jgi:hypothetical protein
MEKVQPAIVPAVKVNANQLAKSLWRNRVKYVKPHNATTTDQMNSAWYWDGYNKALEHALLVTARLGRKEKRALIQKHGKGKKK